MTLNEFFEDGYYLGTDWNTVQQKHAIFSKNTKIDNLSNAINEAYNQDIDKDDDFKDDYNSLRFTIYNKYGAILEDNLTQKEAEKYIESEM